MGTGGQRNAGDYYARSTGNIARPAGEAKMRKIIAGLSEDDKWKLRPELGLAVGWEKHRREGMEADKQRLTYIKNQSAMLDTFLKSHVGTTEFGPRSFAKVPKAVQDLAQTLAANMIRSTRSFLSVPKVVEGALRRAGIAGKMEEVERRLIPINRMLNRHGATGIDLHEVRSMHKLFDVAQRDYRRMNVLAHRMIRPE